jgi:hypothetical protein
LKKLLLPCDGTALATRNTFALLNSSSLAGLSPFIITGILALRLPEFSSLSPPRLTPPLRLADIARALPLYDEYFHLQSLLLGWCDCSLPPAMSDPNEYADYVATIRKRLQMS